MNKKAQGIPTIPAGQLLLITSRIIRSLIGVGWGRSERPRRCWMRSGLEEGKGLVNSTCLGERPGKASELIRGWLETGGDARSTLFELGCY